MTNPYHSLPVLLAIFAVGCAATTNSPTTGTAVEMRHVPILGDDGLFCCAMDDFDMLPERAQNRMRALWSEDNIARSLTLLPVDIDPLDADPETPWVVFAEAISVRDAPSLHPEQSTVIDQLGHGTEVVGTYSRTEEWDHEWLAFEHDGRMVYSHRMGFTRTHPSNIELINRYGDLPIGDEIVNRWWGIPINYEASDIVDIPQQYTTAADTENPGSFQLRRPAVESMIQMLDAARADGITLYASSPYRSGERQVAIYTRNIRNNPGQRSSAPPGHSEHQLGTTVDFASDTRANGGRFLRNTDEEWHWMRDNAHRFGWVQTYRAENIHQTGYIEEPWHWRFFGMPGDDPGTDVSWSLH